MVLRPTVCLDKPDKVGRVRAARTVTLSTKTLTDFDMHLWAEGSHFRAYEKLGAHPIERNGIAGTQFAVWAPNAREVAVVGDFNGWRATEDPLYPVGSTGIWAGFVPGVGPGAVYKYAITSHNQGYKVEKADPYAFRADLRPRTGSVVWDLS